MMCIDMDGTLLNSKHVINEENIEAIKKATEKGVLIAVCTGRLFTSAAYFADLIGVKTPVIASNGAYIRDKNTDKVIYKSLLGNDNCNKIMNILRKYNIYPHFNSYDSIFTEKIVYSSEFYSRMNETLPRYRRIKIKLVENWENVFKEYEGEILKCIAIDQDIDKLKLAKMEMLKEEDLEVVSSWENNFEVMQKGVSKGKAVNILAKHYSINREDIICIGDSENDLSMIKFAGLGIAMGNASDYIKKNSDYVTVTNDESGVAKAIYKFVL